MTKTIAIALTAIFMAHVSPAILQAENKKVVKPGENIRVVLTVEKEKEKPSIFNIVTTGDRTTLNNILKEVEIDGRKVPALLRFEAQFTKREDKDYLLSCTYGIEMPIVTGSATGKDGVVRSQFQYRNMGAQTTVRIKLGEEIVLLTDPKDKVTLKLEPVEGAD